MAGGRRVGAFVALVVGLVAGAGCALPSPPAGGSPAAVTATRLFTPDGEVIHRAEGINDAGEITAELVDRAAPIEPRWYLWRDGEATRIVPDVTFMQVADLSERGQVAGSYGSPFGDRDAFSWRRGTWTQLADDGGYAVAEAVNERGQIAGSLTPAGSWQAGAAVWDASGRVTVAPISDTFEVIDINNRGQVLLNVSGQPTLWQVGGDVTPLGTLGGDRADGNDLSEAGEVVGTSYTATGELHAFVWRAGRMTDLGTLGGDSSVAWAINEAGQVAGSADTSDGSRHATLWDERGRPTDLGTLGGAPAQAQALNDRGQVIGYSTTPSGGQHAFLWQAGRIIDLTALVSPDAWIGYAADINERGQIVGWNANPEAEDDEDVGVGVLWTARPR